MNGLRWDSTPQHTLFCCVVTPSGQPSVRVYDATATSLSLSWSVPSGSVVDSYELKWISDECPDYVDEGSETVIDPNYIIEDLYDGTHYLITVTATNVAGTSASGMPRAPTRERGKLILNQYCLNAQYSVIHKLFMLWWVL